VKKPYAIEKYVHLLQALQETKDPSDSISTNHNSLTLPTNNDNYFMYSRIIHNNALQVGAHPMQDKEPLKMEEWIYLENETLAEKLSPPPELPGEEEIQQAHASPASSVPNEKPPPKLPDDQANSITWPLSKLKIRATTPILQCIKDTPSPLDNQARE
jgi:hypothetical protein